MLRVYLIFFVVCLAQGLQAQDLPGVSLPANSYDISAVREWDTIAIPLMPGKGVAYGDIQLGGASPVWVRFSQRYDESFLQGIHLSLSPDRTKLLAAVDLGILKAAGAYEVRIALVTKGQAKGEPQGQRQELNLIFNRPAAKLDADHVVSIHAIGDAIVSSDAYKLKETGNQSSLFHLPLQPPTFAGVKGSPLIRFPDSSYTVNAGQLFQPDYVIDSGRIGDLPLGTTKGTMDISSPSLSAPVTVNFEITHTRPRYWIFICLLAGLAAGNFVRLFLSNKRLLEEKREEGYALLVQIERDTVGIKDAVFCQRVAAICAALKTVLDADAGLFVGGTKKLRALTDLIATTHSQYNDAKKILDDSLKALQGKAQAISPLFVNNNLSPYLTHVLVGAADYYQQAVSYLNASDAQHASEQLTAALNAVKKFATEYADLNGNVLGLIDAFKDGSGYPSDIDSSDQQVITQSSSRLEDALKAIPAVGDDPSKLTATIQAIDSVQANLQKLLHFVVETVSNAFMADYGDQNDPDMIVFKKAFDRWKAAMADVLEDPLAIFDKGAVAGLSKAWSTAKVNVGRNQPDTSIFQSVQTKKTAGDTVLWPWVKVSRYLSAGMPVALRSLAPTPEEGERQAGNSYLLYSIVQTFFLLVVMSLAAYKFYAPSFVGTFEDMLSIFLVAFGTDITVDKVNVWKPG